MSGRVEQLATDLEALVDRGELDRALGLLQDVRPADAADLIESLDDDRLAQVVDHWDARHAAEVLTELQDDRRAALVQRIPPARLADILDVMAPDEAADFLGEVPAADRARLLGRMEREEASDVAELLDFPEGSAGRRMSQDFVAVSEETTVQAVIDRLREVPDDVELIYYVYVLGGSEQLKGVVSLRKLITAGPGVAVGELMQEEVVAVRPEEEIGAAQEIVRRYNLLALPVTDEYDRMLGIVTVDDLMESIEEEGEHHLLRFAGSLDDREHASYRTWTAIRKRLPWLAAATVIELLVAYALLRPLPPDLLVALIAYVPLLIFVGGNTAVQAAARVFVRLSGSPTEVRNPWRQARREVEAGAVLAFLAAAATFPLLLMGGKGLEFAAVVTPAVAVTVLAGAGLGACLPIVLRRFRIDPAIASGPLLGTAMDALSLFIYVTVAVQFSRFLV
ncbi:MAG: magnesium transporter [Actinomycetota bacterium]